MKCDKKLYQNWKIICLGTCKVIFFSTIFVMNLS